MYATSFCLISIIVHGSLVALTPGVRPFPVEPIILSCVFASYMVNTKASVGLHASLIVALCLSHLFGSVSFHIFHPSLWALIFVCLNLGPAVAHAAQFTLFEIYEISFFRTFSSTTLKTKANQGFKKSLAPDQCHCFSTLSFLILNNKAS